MDNKPANACRRCGATAYRPVIARDANGASAISYATWGLWTGSNLATALYAYANLRDAYLAGVSIVYAACCAAVIALTIAKRRRSAARSAQVLGRGALQSANRIEMPAGPG